MNFIEEIILKIPGVMIALVASGFGQALCAHLMGDETPKNTGKLSFSPRAHIDPIGFLFFMIARFGWSKPVMINPNNFRNRNLGLALYFISGSMANIAVAIVFLWIIKILSTFSMGFEMLYVVLLTIVQLNMGLAAIQLIPIPPFSGYYFLRQILPYKITRHFQIVEQYSMIIFLVLVISGMSVYIVTPIYTLISMIVKIFTGM